MGRNPLDRLQEVLDEPMGPSTFSSLRGSQGQLSTFEKIKEMQIEVDWPELYRSTLGQPVKKLLRFLSIN